MPAYPSITDPSCPVVEVGRYYLVPHVFMEARSLLTFSETWTPIFGPLHEDREFIKFDQQHWHIDWRFVSPRLWKSINSYRRPQQILATVASVQNTGAEVIELVRKCQRPMPLWKSHFSADRGGNLIARWLPDLEDYFAERRLRCGKCPHRGLDLTTIPADADGAVVCPGHGLAFNKATGSLIRRCAPLNSQPSSLNSAQ